MKDQRGNEITLGCTFAMPFAKHSSGYLRVGKVIELIPEKQIHWGGTIREKIRVEWMFGSDYSFPKKSIVDNYQRGLVLYKEEF